MSKTAGWVLTPTKVLRTDDGGASWRPMSIPAVQNFGAPGMFFVLGSHAWSVSAPEDGPFTVTRVSADGTVLEGRIPRPPGAFPSLSLSFANSSQGWAAVLKTTGDGRPGRSDIWSTRDGGATWSPVATDTSHWISTQQTSVWATDDAGAHWSLLTNHAGAGSIDALSFPDTVHGWALTSPGCGEIACPSDSPSDTLDATDDGGTHWAEVALPSD